MEEVVAGGGCGQVIGRLVLYSERLRPIARADWLLSLRVFPCMLQQLIRQPACNRSLRAGNRSFRQRALDKTWHHGHAKPTHVRRLTPPEDPKANLCAATPNLCAATLPC